MRVIVEAADQAPSWFWEPSGQVEPSKGKIETPADEGESIGGPLEEIDSIDEP